MNASEQPSDHGDSQSTGVCMLSLLALLLLVVQIVFSLVTLPLLPDIVPSHLNTAGQVNGTIPKLGFVLIFVGVNLVLFILFRGIRAVVQQVDWSKIQLWTLIASVVTLIPLGIPMAKLKSQLVSVISWAVYSRSYKRNKQTQSHASGARSTGVFALVTHLYRDNMYIMMSLFV